jgi:hypothetical protein
MGPGLIGWFGQGCGLATNTASQIPCHTSGEYYDRYFNGGFAGLFG